MTRMAILAGLALAVALAPGAGARADEWDTATDSDNGASTDNGLLHGSAQVHDLAFGAALDQDWYRVASHPFSSYEAVIDGMTGDLDFQPASLQRLDESGTTVLSSATVTELGSTLSLPWMQGTAASPVPGFLRVQGAFCGTACTGADSYRIRFYETTYTIPRFNNSGTQSTILLVQNATDRTCIIAYYFMAADGSLLVASGSELTPRELEVVPTATLVPGQAGSVRIGHTCGYGGLSGKAVAVEPATGFTFDTPIAYRPD